MIGCRPLSDNEIELILENLETLRDKTLFILNLYTGFRIQESLSLRVCDVNERVNVARKNTKGKIASRSMVLHPVVQNFVTTLVQQESLNAEDYLFQSRKGINKAISRTQAYRTLKAAVNKAGLTGKVALHSTRKTFAERVYNNLNKDLIKTSKALGHKNISSTVSYLSFDNKEIDEAIFKF